MRFARGIFCGSTSIVCSSLLFLYPRGGRLGINALFSFFPHSLAHLLPQIINVVARNDGLHSVNQFGLRTGILFNDLALFDQVDLHFQFFQRHTIAEIAVEPISFLDNDAAGIGILLKEMPHFSKSFPTGGFGGFHIYKLLHNGHFVSGGVFAQQFQLCGDGISFPFLVLTRNSGIKNCFFHFSSPSSLCASFSNSFLIRSISASKASITLSRSESRKIKPCLSSKRSLCLFTACKRLNK